MLVVPRGHIGFTGLIAFRQHVVHLRQPAAIASWINDLGIELHFTMVGKVHGRMGPENPGFVRRMNRCHAPTLLGALPEASRLAERGSPDSQRMWTERRIRQFCMRSDFCGCCGWGQPRSVATAAPPQWATFVSIRVHSWLTRPSRCMKNKVRKFERSSPARFLTLGSNESDQPRMNTNGHQSGQAGERHGLHGFSRNSSVPMGEIRVCPIRVDSWSSRHSCFMNPTSVSLLPIGIASGEAFGVRRQDAAFPSRLAHIECSRIVRHPRACPPCRQSEDMSPRSTTLARSLRNVRWLLSHSCRFVSIRG